MNKIKIKEKLTPTFRYSELPECIQKVSFRTTLLCIFLLFFSLLFFTKLRLLSYFLYSLLLIVGLYIAFIFWYAQFAFNRAVYLEGTITDVKEQKPGINGVMGKFFSRMIALKMQYTLKTSDGLCIEIINNTGKRPAVGQQMRIFYLPSNLYSIQEDKIRLSGTLYTEKIKERK